jgi:inosine-uridine nucleoside N-ribohydrolase
MGGSLEPNPFVPVPPQPNKADRGLHYGCRQIPYAEFNINIDPDAVKIVLDSGIPLTMVPMELGHTAYLTPAETEKGKTVSPVGKIFHDIFPQYTDRHVIQPNIATHDMTAVCVLTNPELITFRPCNLSLVYDEHGQTAIEVDRSLPPNATVAAEIDVTGLRKLYLKMLTYYDV